MNVRVTIFLLLVLSLFAGYLYFYELRKSPKSEPEPPFFYSLAYEDIESISLRVAEGEGSFVRKSSDWYFNDAEGLPVDSARWGGIAVLLSGPKSRRILSETQENLDLYGLDQPSARIGLGLKGNRRVEVTLGQKTPDGLSNYSLMAGQPQIFLVDSSWGDVLGRLVTEPPYPEWYYKVPAERVIFLAVNYNGTEVAFVKQRSGWEFDNAESTPVDQARWAVVEPLLGGPPSLRVLSYDLKDPAQYGLDVSDTMVTVTFSPPPTLREQPNRFVELTIGSKREDGQTYFAQIRDKPYLFSVDVSWIELLRKLVLDPPVPKAGQAAGGA
ncbi:MAG: DUF4340 domain-containing protein [Chloroflexi bacterium]|nr:DUF4340 domain-containing protein [Chloroflexota bacterium]